MGKSRKRARTPEGSSSSSSSSDSSDSEYESSYSTDSEADSESEEEHDKRKHSSKKGKKTHKKSSRHGKKSRRSASVEKKAEKATKESNKEAKQPKQLKRAHETVIEEKKGATTSKQAAPKKPRAKKGEGKSTTKKDSQKESKDVQDKEEVSNGRKNLPPVHFQLQNTLAHFPQKGYNGDIAYDLSCCHDVHLPALSVREVDTHITAIVPEGYYLQIHSRSSLAKHFITVAGGIIDQTYKGTLKVVLHNGGHKPYKITAGERMAQLIIHKQHPLPIVYVDADRNIKTDILEWIHEGERGEKGLGSSGR